MTTRRGELRTSAPASATRRGSGPSPPPPARRWLFPPEQMGRQASTTDKGHGRREKRTLRTTTILTLHRKWPGLAQGFELTRERTEKGRTTVGGVPGITRLRPEQDARPPVAGFGG